MRQRARKLVGAFVMVGFAVIYPLLMMALAQTHPVQAAEEPWRTLIYFVLGVGWAAPMAPLIKWMARPDRD